MSSDGLLRFDETTASIYSGLKPEPLRFLYYHPGMRMIFIFSAVLTLATGGLVAGGYALSSPGWWPGLAAAGLYLLALLLSPVLFIVLLFLLMGFNPARRNHELGLLTPGVVVESKPLAVVSLASLSNGSGPNHHGLVRINPIKLPCHSHEPGTRLPLASIFYQGKGIDRWVSFLPEPVSWGTGRLDHIEHCMDLIGEEDFQRLEELIARGIEPKTEDELILLDENDNQLEALSIKEERKKYEPDDPSK